MPPTAECGIDTIDPAYCTVADGDGKTIRRPRQASMWVAAQDRPRSAAHPFYARLNQILDTPDVDGTSKDFANA